MFIQSEHMLILIRRVIKRFYGIDTMVPDDPFEHPLEDLHENVNKVFEDPKIKDSLDEETLTEVSRLKSIFDCENEGTLRTIAEQMEIAREQGVNFGERIQELDSDIKAICCKDIVDSLTICENDPNIPVRLEEGELHIYDMTGIDFKALISVIAYSQSLRGSFARELVEDPSKWYKGDYKSTISTSLISNEFWRCISSHPELEVILGFNRIPPEAIVGMSNEDMWTTHEDNAILPESRSGRYNYFTSDVLIEKTNDHSIGNSPFNDIAIFRERQELSQFSKKATDIGTDSRRYTPDFIMCFDEINERSKQWAEYFGIPIYFVDTKELEERRVNEGMKKIVNMVADPKTTENLENILLVCAKVAALQNHGGTFDGDPDNTQQYNSSMYELVQAGITQIRAKTEQMQNADKGAGGTNSGKLSDELLTLIHEIDFIIDRLSFDSKSGLFSKEDCDDIRQRYQNAVNQYQEQVEALRTPIPRRTSGNADVGGDGELEH